MELELNLKTVATNPLITFKYKSGVSMKVAFALIACLISTNVLANSSFAREALAFPRCGNVDYSNARYRDDRTLEDLILGYLDAGAVSTSVCKKSEGQYVLTTGWTVLGSNPEKRFYDIDLVSSRSELRPRLRLPVAYDGQCRTKFGNELQDRQCKGYTHVSRCISAAIVGCEWTWNN